MKYILFLVAFVNLSISCLGQHKIKDFTFSVDFAPAFMEEGKLAISAATDSTSIDLQVIKYTSKNKLIYVYHSLINTNELTSLANSLKAYKHWQSDSKKRNDDLTIGTDGITIYGIWTQDGKVKKFRYWNGGGSGALKRQPLIENLIDIMQKSFKDYHRAMDYVNRLKKWL
jgi:hypothetical protein